MSAQNDVGDYSVYIIQIKTLLRQLEDYCLKAEVSATKEEFGNAYNAAHDASKAIDNLRVFMIEKHYKSE